MFDIKINKTGTIQLIGRFDAARAEQASAVFDTIGDDRIVDFKELEYISSAGLGILLKTQKRLGESGHQLKLQNMNKHIFDVFRYAGFDMIFEITQA